MADVRAFRGIRFDLGTAGPLSDLVAPPYDVIDAALQQRLYDASPFNAIRLELTKEEPGDTEHHNRYGRAAAALRDWQNVGALAQDSSPRLYVYEQEFTAEGKTYRRRGFIGRVRLEPFGNGRIFPHEETMAGPKADRLSLYRATAMNLSPVFGLYPDPEGEAFANLDAILLKTLPLEAKDHLGVVSRLWPISDPGVINKVTAAMQDKPVFIADGHHRYETSLKYLEERRAAGEVANDDAAPNFVMMMFVSMSDPGLIILPTHRLISGLPDIVGGQLKAALATHFDCEIVGTGDAAAKECWELVEADGSQAMFGFGTVADGVWQTARFKTPEVMRNMAADHSAAWQELAVSVLHVLVLNKLIPDSLGLTEPPPCKYVHLMREVTDAMAAKSCQLAALVPPATMGHVEEIAGGREKMPAKSTYFYPKLLTGLVFHSLKGN